MAHDIVVDFVTVVSLECFDVKRCYAEAAVEVTSIRFECRENHICPCGTRLTYLEHRKYELCDVIQKMIQKMLVAIFDIDDCLMCRSRWFVCKVKDVEVNRFFGEEFIFLIKESLLYQSVAGELAGRFEDLWLIAPMTVGARDYVFRQRNIVDECFMVSPDIRFEMRCMGKLREAGRPVRMGKHVRMEVLWMGSTTHTKVSGVA